MMAASVQTVREMFGDAPALTDEPGPHSLCVPRDAAWKHASVLTMPV